MNVGFFKTITLFFRLYRIPTLVVVVLLLLAGFAEAIGVASFLPFLQIILGGQEASTQPNFMTDTLARFGLVPDFITVSALIVTAMTVKAALQFCATRYVSHTVASVATDLRMRFMTALLQANWRYFVTHTLGASLNAIAAETFLASTAFVSAARFLSSCIQFLVYATSALMVSWLVFAGGAFFGLLIVCALWFLVRIARRAGHQQTEIAKKMLTQLADMLQGIKPVRAMALEGKFTDILKVQSEGLRRAQMDQLNSAQSMRIFNEPLMVIAGVCGLYFAVTYGGLEGSALILMGVLFMRMLTSMNTAQAEYQRLATQESALWSLLRAIEESEGAGQIATGRAPVPDGSLSFDRVSFRHGARALLLDVTLQIPDRGLTVLFGASGSGKTTLLDLICGFYQPESGYIRVGETSLAQIDLRAWRRKIGFVPQEVFLFNDTILENVRMGRADISETQVQAALEAAGAWDFVHILPAQMQESVGENGRRFSGGQRQRIAIARAIVGQPKFLLLDEATSALDPETEQRLLETLKALSQTMSIVFVSHNQSILRYADAIYELNEAQLTRKTL